MSIKFNILATIVFIALTSARVDAAEGKILIHTQETPRLQITSNKLVGTVSGKLVEIELSIADTGTDSRLLFSTAIDGTSVGDHSIDLKRLPSIDLGSASYFADSGKGTIKVELRFSEERDCFVNDDGRDQLVVVFRQGRAPESYVMVYENCEPSVQALDAE